METSTLLLAVLSFVAAAAAAVGAHGLWEHLRQRRSWKSTVETVARITARARSAEELGAASVLNDRAVTGPLEELALLRGLTVLLEQAAVSWGLAGFFIRGAGLGLGLSLVLVLLTGGAVFVPVALAVGLALPYLQLRRARATRLSRFEEQFPEAVDLLARAIRAGHPFSSGLKMVTEETREPLAGEFRRVFEEQKFGLSVSESLHGLARRVDLLDVRIFVTAVSIQREVGGNLAEILDQISLTIRERFKIQRQVGVYTAQGRMTGLLLALLPVGLGLLLTILNPGYMGSLYREPAGQAMLAAAVVMQFVGYGLIRRITAIEV
jgi:tight adherence protein B